VILIMGSAHCARSIRNPWTAQERREMIQAVFPDDVARLHFYAIEDRYNDALWVQDVQQAVQQITQHTAQAKIGMIGCFKDQTSYYLTLFPNWHFINIKQTLLLNATDLRNLYFGKQTIAAQSGLPAVIEDYLKQFMQTPAYKELTYEAQYIQSYKDSWKSSPFPPIFVTVDCVVLHQNKVLLIERKDYPGKGLMALPGGFIEVSETLQQSAVRELYEETQVDLPVQTLLMSLRHSKVFDHPLRSMRGRTITHVFCFQLPDDMPTPNVQGGDDAAKALWCSMDDLKMDTFFEDHYHIVQTMCQGLS